LNAITSIPNFMKIYQAVQKLLVGDTDRQTGDLISLLSFLESRLKIELETNFRATKNYSTGRGFEYCWCSRSVHLASRISRQDCTVSRCTVLPAAAVLTNRLSAFCSLHAACRLYVISLVGIVLIV
jgi:hypothetical protein